ncbi:MAG: hypothetical protein LBU60_02160 [Clostridiales bacterium]|nr:hypothetical protein [Clostridiales bacterium]
MSIIQGTIDKLVDTDIGINFGAGEYLKSDSNTMSGKVTFAKSVEVDRKAVSNNVMGNGLIKSEVIKVWLKGNNYVGLELVLGKVQQILAKNGYIPISGFEYVEPIDESNMQLALSFKFTGHEVLLGNGGSGVDFSDSPPLMDSVANAGISSKASRADHVHPSDTIKQDKLISAQNIKSINGQSLLGTGNLDITAEGVKYTQVDIWIGDPEKNNINIEILGQFVASSVNTSTTTVGKILINPSLEFLHNKRLPAKGFATASAYPATSEFIRYVYFDTVKNEVYAKKNDSSRFIIPLNTPVLVDVINSLSVLKGEKGESFSPEELISSDVGNAIKLGKDGKLFYQP